MRHEIKVTKEFSTKTKKTERVLKTAEAFGLGLEDRKWTVFRDFTISIKEGDIVYITGQSGAGKSILLQEIKKQLSERGLKVGDLNDVKIYEKPLIDQIAIDKEVGEAIRLLSVAGISDAYLYIRQPNELSDGQKYRFKLAKLLDQNIDVIIADEFGAVLDRVTAKIVAFNIAKLVRKLKKTLIVATTHTDLEEELAPDIVIYKRYQNKVDIRIKNE